MRTELTITELEAETVELLPARETLFGFGNHNFANVLASNSSTAFNVYTSHSAAYSQANQWISVSQH